ncbi:dihydroxy-acid dehydratase [compost metagenome]
MNYGLSFDELQSGRPVIGIAQTGSDIAPCNRHHIVLAQRVKEGIRDANSIAAAPHWRPPEGIRFPRAKRRGRKFSALSFRSRLKEWS